MCVCGVIDVSETPPSPSHTCFTMSELSSLRSADLSPSFPLGFPSTSSGKPLVTSLEPPRRTDLAMTLL